MDKEKDSGIMEVVAIAALLFLFWKFYIKKKEIPEPATTPAELKDQFARDPNFNLNDYCKDVIYRPLSSSDLSPSNLLGEGWCYRGDRSAIDESKGFGDAYAEKQAENYQSMKEEEAVFVTNKSCIQFRLINSTASPITTDVLDVTTQSLPFDPTPDAPIALSASSVEGTSFVANLSEVSNASGYRLDVSADINFTSFISGYEDKDIGNNLSYTVSGLSDGNTYYYRVRAYNTNSTSLSSNVITTTTESYTEINDLVTGWTAFGTWDTFTSSGNDITSAIKDISSSVYCNSNNISVIPGTKLKFVIDCNLRSGDSPQLYVMDLNHSVVIQGTNILLEHGVNNILFTVPDGCNTVRVQLLNVINYDYRVNLDFEATL